MSKLWFSADWHLGEDRFDVMGRPFTDPKEHIAHLQYKHNAVVSPDDTVILVGDACYQKHPEYLKYIADFNGKKTLIRGNHDRVFTDDDLKPYFDTVVAEGEGLAFEIGGRMYYATHYPTRGLSNAFNLVGHIHGAWKVQLNMLNVGVDCHHFEPVNADELGFYVDAVTKFYDEDVWVAYEHANECFRGKRGKSGRYFNPA